MPAAACIYSHVPCMPMYMGLSVFNACMDCTEAVFVGFSVTSERSYRIDVLMFSSVFDERAISAQATSPPIIIATAHTVCMVHGASAGRARLPGAGLCSSYMAPHDINQLQHFQI